jgi:hypothetical protein
VDAAFATRYIVGDTGLCEPALDGVGQKFFMPVTPRAPTIDQRDQLAVFIIGISVDAGERADTTGCRPCAGAFTI